MRRLGLLLLFALIPAGCDTCTDAVCEATLMIVRGWDGAALLEGVYEIELTLDDDTTSITCDQAQPNTSCDVDGELAAVTDSSGRVQIRFEGAPASYQLLVTKPDGEAASFTDMLTYEESRPNGPRCGPVCQTADEDLVFEIQE